MVYLSIGPIFCKIVQESLVFGVEPFFVKGVCSPPENEIKLEIIKPKTKNVKLPLN